MATFTKKIAASADDASQKYSTVTLVSNTIALGYSAGGSTTNGFRFNDVTVPQHAVITNAYVTFRSYTDGVNALSVRISCGDVDNIATFAESGNTPSSVALTSAYTDWTPSAWDNYTAYNTPDISTSIQEVVDRAGWRGGNSLAVMVTNLGDNARSVYAYDNGISSYYAELTIEYNEPEQLYIDATSQSNTQSGNTVTWSHTCSGENRALVVVATSEYTPNQITGTTSCTYNGVAMTQSVAVSGDNKDNRIFTLINPPTGAHDIVMTWGKADMTNGYQRVLGISFGHADQTTLVGGTTTWAGTVYDYASISPSLTVQKADSITVQSVYASDARTIVAESGQTTTVEVTTYGKTYGYTKVNSSTGSNSYSFRCASGSSASSSSLAEIRPLELGPTGMKSVNGLVKASVKSIKGLALASVKSWNGLE